MNKSILLLCCSVFILVTGTGLVAPLISPYANQLGATGVWIGLLFSGFYIIRLLLGSPIGRLADKRGPKYILWLSFSFYPLIALAYSYASTLPTLLGARILHGIASAMLLPIAMTYIGILTPIGKEGKYMGIYNSFILLANSIGPILGGYIADYHGYQSSFMALFYLSVPAFVFILFLPNIKKQNHIKSNQSFTFNKELFSIGAIYFVIAVLDIFIITFLPLILHDHHFSLLTIGLLLALNKCIGGILQVPLGRMTDRYSKTKILTYSSFATITLVLSLGFINKTSIIVTFIILLGISSAVTLATVSGISTILGRRIGMGKVMGYIGSSTSIGMAIGPLAIGYLSDILEMSFAFFFIASLWIIALVIFSFEKYISIDKLSLRG